MFVVNCNIIAVYYKHKKKTLYYIIHINNIQKESMHCQNKSVKITNLLVSIAARNSVNYSLIGRVGCYDYMVTYM